MLIQLITSLLVAQLTAFINFFQLTKVMFKAFLIKLENSTKTKVCEECGKIDKFLRHEAEQQQLDVNFTLMFVGFCRLRLLGDMADSFRDGCGA